MKTTISILLLLSCQSIFSRTINSPIPPVELTSFTGQVEDSCVHLFWTTDSEFNNLGFEIERAIQIGQWQKMGFVEGKGTTNEPQTYEFKDSLINIIAEKIYYRLKQIDFDGSFQYSGEIEILLQQITLRDTTNQYDYIIITVPEFVNVCGPFKQHKETVRDFRTLIVDTTQIYAEFDSSAAPQDNIRDFISYAGTFWKEPKPKYFLLVGDLSKVPAFPDIFDFGPYLDTAYTDFKYSVNNYSNDTTTCYFQIGRVPAKYEYEIQNYTSKVITYETDTIYSNWMNNNFVVKQVFPDSPRTQLYNNIVNQLLMDYPEHFNNYLYAESDTLPQGADRDSIINFLNTTGTSSLWLIGDFWPFQFGFYGMLDTSDVSLINNGLKYFIAFCFANQSFTFESSTNSLANRFLLDDNAAISVIAPVGLVFVSQNAVWLYKVSTEMFGQERKSLGSALNSSRNSFPNSYTIRMINLLGDPSIHPKYDVTAGTNPIEVLPTNFVLYQNYPNPFNPTTTIKFALPVDSRVKVNIYNSLGQLVETLVDEEMESGYHEVNFDASRLASGVYFYQLQTGNYISVKKMLLLK